jgi:hypothetical protein
MVYKYSYWIQSRNVSGNSQKTFFALISELVGPITNWEAVGHNFPPDQGAEPSESGLLLLSVLLQSTYGPSPPLIFWFPNLFRHLVGLLGRVISSSQGLYLHRTTNIERRGQTSMPWAEFEPAIQCASDQGPRLRPYDHWIGRTLIPFCNEKSKSHTNKKVDPLWLLQCTGTATLHADTHKTLRFPLRVGCSQNHWLPVFDWTHSRMVATPVSCWGGPRFESRHGDQLPWLEICS